MTKQFQSITKSEMEDFLLPQGFQPMTVPDATKELVYGKLVRKGEHQVSMRVYTSLNPDGVSRGLGKDAIRVMLFIKYDGQPTPVGKARNVLRINTWRKNLQKAIDRWQDEWRDCPACGHPMVIRNGRHGEFWGCSTWHKTKCDGRTRRSVLEAPKPVEPTAGGSLYEKLVKMQDEPVVSQPEPKPEVKPQQQRQGNRYRIPDHQISKEQKAVEVAFITTERNLLTPSRAGGGKTTLLKHLASFRPEGKRMIYMAFNKKNAKEGRKKLPREVSSMTTHAFCGQLLRERMSMPEQADQSKNYQVMEEVYPAFGSADRRRIRRAAFKLIGLAKNFAIRPKDVDGIRNVMEQYEFDLQNAHEENEVINIVDDVLQLSIPGAKYGSLYDYDDMLWWTCLLELSPKNCDIALLDEVQDFNACQIEIVRRLMDGGTRLVAVGDPYQAVYRFRGADSDAFAKVAAVLESGKRGCQSILLPTSYRNGRSIIRYVVENTVVNDIVAAPNAIEGEVREDLCYGQIVDLLVAEYGQHAA